MKSELKILSQRYVKALRKHLKAGQKASLTSARGLGSRALAAGLQTLDLACLHEQIMVTDILPNCPADKRAALFKQAGVFFAAAIIPVDKSERTERHALIQQQFIEALSEHTVELAASNLELSQEILQRRAAEDSLKKSERHYAQLLEHSVRLQEQLRELSRRVLSAQENERRKISRELHDVIGQTLTGINIRLATLRKEATSNKKDMDRNIQLTQRLVEHSVNVVHKFARELRPAALDDLGLIPALLSYMKSFTERNGVRTSLTAFANVERLDAAKRTVLYRVVQEALTNVSRHARASHVEVTIQNLAHRIRMKIKDDGKSFDVERVLRGGGGKRLGLLGMRERLEMVGGNFEIESTLGTGTTLIAHVPFDKARARKARKTRGSPRKSP